MEYLETALETLNDGEEGMTVQRGRDRVWRVELGGKGVCIANASVCRRQRVIRTTLLLDGCCRGGNKGKDQCDFPPQLRCSARSLFPSLTVSLRAYLLLFTDPKQQNVFRDGRRWTSVAIATSNSTKKTKRTLPLRKRVYIFSASNEIHVNTVSTFSITHSSVSPHTQFHTTTAKNETATMEARHCNESSPFQSQKKAKQSHST